MPGALTLYWAPTSPFVRLVTAAAHELGVAGRFRLVEATVENIVDVVSPVNPLAQIPTLVLEDGAVLYDSATIVAWLDARYGAALAEPLGGRGADRWRIATRTAAATGLMDAAVAERHLALQPDGHRPDGFIERLRARRMRVLDHLAGGVAPAEAPVTTDALAAACALAYLDFRFPSEDWRGAHPALAEWFAAFGRRPSMQATAPDAPPDPPPDSTAAPTAAGNPG